MENYISKSYESYFKSLKQVGYISYDKMQSLLILMFIYELLFKYTNEIIDEGYYNTIEKALSCLYGRNCLVPYGDYVKMKKLYVGKYTELMHQITNLTSRIEALTNGTPLPPDLCNDDCSCESAGRLEKLEKLIEELINKDCNCGCDNTDELTEEEMNEIKSLLTELKTLVQGIKCECNCASDLATVKSDLSVVSDNVLINHYLLLQLLNSLVTNKMDITDLNTIINIILGKEEYQKKYDFNGNGIIDITDYNVALNRILGQSVQTIAAKYKLDDEAIAKLTSMTEYTIIEAEDGGEISGSTA